jgi:hypothetical protein
MNPPLVSFELRDNVEVKDADQTKTGESVPPLGRKACCVDKIPAF